MAEALAVLLHLNEELASKLLSARERNLVGSRDTVKGRDAFGQYQEINTYR